MDINFNDWEFHELSNELKGMTLHQMLDKYKVLDTDMSAIAANFMGNPLEGKSENEEKYDTVHRQQVYVAMRIAKEMTGV